MEKLSVNNLLYACIEKFYKNTGIRYFMMLANHSRFTIQQLLLYCVRCSIVYYPYTLSVRLLVSITPCVSESTDTKNAVESM